MSGPVRPAIGSDNAYFFEGTACSELRIQRCNACGALRHPPGPACPECGAFERGYVVADGEGTVFSYVVHHAPRIPGKELPLTIALVDLDEGVRMVAEMAGPVEIGDRVRVGWNVVDDELTLPLWTKVER
ncbi:MAG: OB-fold domain-containing protein [Nocardioidaceae bacterium]|nr:OB-fold domain-containing protein [Nocardioidaceae bacterium]